MNSTQDTEIKSVSFKFFTNSEIQKNSVVEISNSIAFDNKTPNQFGLYDPRMGIGPMDKQGICPTCQSSENQCPGHQGHIKLVFPIYNVFMVKEIHKLLQSKCFKCHQFTLSPSLVKNFVLIIKCLKFGLLKHFQFFRDFEIVYIQKKIQLNSEKRKNSKSTTKSDSENQKGFSEKQKEIEKLFKELQEKLLKMKKQMKKEIKNMKNDYDFQPTKYTKEMISDFLKEFFSKAKQQSYCLHCNEIKPSIKKEGLNKFLVKEKDKQYILNPYLVREHLRELFKRENSTIQILFSNFQKTDNEKGYHMETFKPDYYFLEYLPVSPNRFRPESVINDQVYLHAHTVLYTKILQINNELMSLQIDNEEIFKQNEQKDIHKKAIAKWIELQDVVNILFDSSINVKANEKYTGIKQILEKKEGIFRMKIMGKRVNYSARSVISPDPYLDSDEVGIPLFMAKILTFPEYVNNHNIESLQQLIINGPLNYPGAVEIKEKNFKRILENSTLEQRQLIANKLAFDKENKIVYRHARDGDVILFNRQPTLHKPSLMAFKIRVLPKESTIRMHYVNCSGFNADFDGDEMNVHLLQNYLARAEGLNLALCDKQYILATNKNPIRGFIQDFIFSGVFVTFKDQFFTKSDYQQLLYDSLFKIIEDDPCYNDVVLLNPNIIKPKKLWTGKQLFSNIIDYIARYESNPLETRVNLLNMKIGSRVNKNYFEKVSSEENEILIKNNILIKGIIDKNSIGASSFGLIHTFYELFGHIKTKMLISAITRLCINYLKLRGFSCGLQDLQLQKEAEKQRKIIMEDLHHLIVEEQAKYLDSNYIKIEPFFEPNSQKIMKKSFEKNNFELLQKAELVNNEKLDEIVRNTGSKLQSQVTQITVGQGLQKKFPLNNFSCMVLTGAKGSVLNHSQVSCNLGQQELEGKRVPLMHSGKTLPSFLPFDINPRCGGLIGDRFLTGLRSQEFYFHCMAGREGLVDTAVKTSRSGYLQRILVKNLESLVVQYDNTVRDIDDKCLVQYIYGEDSLDPVKLNPVENLNYFLNNFETIQDEFKESNPEKFLKFKEQDINGNNPYQSLGTISLKAKERLDKFIHENSNVLLQKNIQIMFFKKVYYWQYFKSLVNHGEPVGAIAAQSFGEPSTQMTLNTFHLAGHGGANVTLGVPRLKELMTTKNTKQSIMTVPFKNTIKQQELQLVLKSFESINLFSWVKKLSLSNRLYLIDNKGNILDKQTRAKKYNISIDFVDQELIQSNFNINDEQFQIVLKKFFEKFNKFLGKHTGQKNKEKEKQYKEDLKEQEELFYKISHQYIDNTLLIEIDIPLNFKIPPLMNSLEEIFQSIKIKKQKNISNYFLLNENDQNLLQIEGMNFTALWKKRKYFETNQIHTNDINIFSEIYGIEAGRNAWVKEVQTVFSHYGIKVDYRHAYLVADHMTYSGKLNPMSRIGIKHNNSPLLKMSFETTMQFLIDSTKNLEKDDLNSCSASLVIGNPVKIGSGFFELRQLIK